MTIENIGQQLKTARQKAEISLDELAERLFLPADKLELLEKNQFEQLSAPTYVAGYIRSYCQQVKIDPEPLVESYLESHKADEPKLHSTSNQPAQINAKDPLFIIMTVVVLLVLLVLIVIWAWESFAKNEAITEQAATLPEIELVLADDELLESDEAPDFAETAIAALEESANTVVINEGNQIDAELPTPVAEPTEETIAADIIDNQESQNITIQSGGQAPTGSDKLSIIVTDSSWLDVRDAAGYRLYYDMLDVANSPISLTGQAPFRIVLGDASVVELRINETRFDVKRYMRNDKSAKFSVK